MKKLPAFIAAMVVSGLVALAMLAIGINALVTPAAAAASSDPAQISVTGGDAQTIEQLQARIREYQAREQQYQQQLEQARAQIEQANSELTTYQQLISSLQEMGNLRFDDDDDDGFSRSGRHEH